MSLKEKLQQDIKQAMRDKNKPLLDVLRLISAAVKQVEVDERIEVSDDRMLVILDKMAKQRQESITHYQAAQRTDLIEQENFELKIIQSYLPEPLSDHDIEKIVDHAFSEIKVQHVSDMGKIIAHIKPNLQGRADMAKVSQQVKAKINLILG